jgi:hypothetical protein
VTWTLPAYNKLAASFVPLASYHWRGNPLREVSEVLKGFEGLNSSWREALME